MESKRRSF